MGLNPVLYFEAQIKSQINFITVLSSQMDKRAEEWLRFVYELLLTGITAKLLWA
mgnify:CR=1 FL=1